MSAPKRITYQDIAQALGVSKMTVSYSLRNDPRISESVRLRVLEKARELGYQRDPMLSALSAYRHGTTDRAPKAAMAWLNVRRAPEKQRTMEVFNRYWLGARETAQQLGYQLEEFRLQEIPLHRLHTMFKARGIRGVILTPTPPDEEPAAHVLDAFPWKDYALVRFGDSLRRLTVNVVSTAQVPNTIRAFEEIQKKGYRRIGFAGHYVRHHLFSAGYLWAQHAVPPGRQLAPLFLPDRALEHQQALLREWLQKETPDAIICASPHILGMLETLGHHIPRDFGLASMSRHDNPINAGIDQNPEEIGRTAAQALAAQLNDNLFGIPEHPKEILVEGRWIDGSMLPKRN